MPADFTLEDVRRVVESATQPLCNKLDRLDTQMRGYNGHPGVIELVHSSHQRIDNTNERIESINSVLDKYGRRFFYLASGVGMTIVGVLLRELFS